MANKVCGKRQVSYRCSEATSIGTCARNSSSPMARAPTKKTPCFRSEAAARIDSGDHTRPRVSRSAPSPNALCPGKRARLVPHRTDSAIASAPHTRWLAEAAIRESRIAFRMAATFGAHARLRVLVTPKAFARREFSAGLEADAIRESRIASPQQEVHMR